MKLWIISGVLLSVIMGAAYFYYNSTQERIRILTENAVQLEENFKRAQEANQQNLQTIDELTSAYEEIQKQYEEVSSEFQSIRTQRQALEERLSRDIDQLSATRPDLVERVINLSTAKVFRCFELATGSPLTDREKNATTAVEFNSECPELFGKVK